MQESQKPPGYSDQRASDTLVRTDLSGGDGFTVTHTVATSPTPGIGVQTDYTVQFLPDGSQVRTTDLPDGTEEQLTIGIDGSRTVKRLSVPDGSNHRTVLSTQTSTSGPDPRFGMESPVTSSTVTQGDVTATINTVREAPLANDSDLTSITRTTEKVIVNGQTVERTYVPATSTYTDTSPENRHTYTVVDAQGRPVKQTVGNLAMTEYHYDGNGKLDGISQGGRITTMTYDTHGNVDSVTDPAYRTVTFTYDDAGRVASQAFDDGRSIGFTYDPKGNLESITPPGHSYSTDAHFFTYYPSGQQQYYNPPQPYPALSDRRTHYRYNLSGQLSRIDRPNDATAEFIVLDHDLETRELRHQGPSTGPDITYNYNSETGDLDNIVTGDGQICAYGYDGSLPTSEEWRLGSGGVGVAGTVSKTYDNTFRVSSQSVDNGSSISFGYDNDNLLTSAGSLTLSRSTSTGLLSGTSIANAADAYGYNGMGEITSYATAVNGNTLYGVSYTRDSLGRITAKTEAVQGTTDSYGYSYDSAGRLADVTKN
ncbi:MAG: RHS repeat protein, partial [Deltaproteobacteria bacterium]|nr:RHS repeat protein [Deltaproteobacteria bacterium]